MLDNLCRPGNGMWMQTIAQLYKSVLIKEVWSFEGKRMKGKYGLLF
ncbi:hypothetical protein HUW51_17745 [Adhaeribacter swui]|uniref:Uncharacterized protein n=1 Tax=Adhaeribacter swui TaxID=2086471 RepID=A0A7G7GBE5_9BACT|nr:hypothetical protein [Adhaeribacter swui]QNF34479.1 hypothetical protein HUW51_17745 [Adhaeribacter swui]